MTESTYRQEKLAGLRALLDYLEANEEVTLPWFGTFHAFPPVGIDEDPETTKVAVGVAARLMKPVEKKFSDSYFSLRKEFGGGVALEMTYDRDQVCQQIVVGQRDVAAIEVEAVEAHTIEATTEDIIEWVCPDSLMADA